MKYDYNDKFAYLIVAHHEPKLLKILVEQLDDDRNDVYIIIDEKSDKRIFSEVKTIKSKLVWVPSIPIYWGHLSIVEAELILFETALKNGNYCYFHLMTGVDLPLKNQDYIHNFFKDNYGKEFVGFANYPHLSHEIKYKVGYYHLMQRHFNTKNIVIKVTERCLNKLSICLQKLIGVDRTKGMSYYKGTHWVSITRDFCEYLVDHKTEMLKRYNHTLASDEIFLHTLIRNSPFRQHLYDSNDEWKGCMRYIHWVGNTAPFLSMKEYDFLMNSDYLFASKFSSKNMDVVEKIVSNITK